MSDITVSATTPATSQPFQGGSSGGPGAPLAGDSGSDPDHGLGSEDTRVEVAVALLNLHENPD